jgi:hypothetical protein
MSGGKLEHPDEPSQVPDRVWECPGGAIRPKGLDHWRQAPHEKGNAENKLQGQKRDGGIADSVKEEQRIIAGRNASPSNQKGTMQ